MLIQRLGAKLQKDPQYIDKLIRIFDKNRGSCDEVWLTTDYGYPPIKKSRDNALILKNVADTFRAAGYSVSLQVANTVGHGQYISSHDCSGLVFEGSPAGRLTDIDGTEAGYCFCCNDPFFRDYIVKTVCAYAPVNPRVLWFDDDTWRVFLHDPVMLGCFCPHCISRFNDENGCDYTREQISDLFRTDIALRNKYTDFMRRSLIGFCTEIAAAFHKLCPETIFGVQYGCLRTEQLLNSAPLFEALHKVSGKAVCAREGGGNYTDHRPIEIVEKYLHINYLNHNLPACVKEKTPEIENTPDVAYGKSPHGTCLETALYLSAGCTGMTYAMIMRDYEPLSYHEKIFARLGSMRAYTERLAELNGSTVQSGVNFVYPENLREKPLAKGENILDLCTEVHHRLADFMRIGLPVSFDGKKDGVYFLTAVNAEALSEKQVTFLLSKPVICEAMAFNTINKKYHAFECDFVAMSGEKGHKCALRFSSNAVNGDMRGKGFPKGFAKSEFYIAEGKAEPLSEYCFEEETLKDFGGTADGFVSSSYGGRWAVFGTDLLNPVINVNRKNQIINICNAVCENSIKVKVLSPCQVMLMPREDKTGRIAGVSVLNMSTGESGRIRLKISFPAGNRFVFMTQNGKEKEIFVRAAADGVSAVLPSVPAWSMATLFIS